MSAAIGVLSLAVAVVCASILSVSQMPGMTAPGCGPGGGCDKLKTSALGVVPGTGPIFPETGDPLLLLDKAGWPTAYLGLAFFVGLVVAYVATLRTGPPAALRWIARVGGVASAVYLGVMFTSGTICPWCVGVHLANFAFVGVIEATHRSIKRAPSTTNRHGVGPNAIAILPALVAFLAVSVGLGVAHRDAAQTEIADAQQEGNRFLEGLEQNAAIGSDTDREVIGDATVNEESSETAAGTANADDDAGADDEGDASPSELIASFEAPDLDWRELDLVREPLGPDRMGTGGFTGRYSMGPEQARVRMVVYANPVCPFCRRLHTELLDILRDNESVSLSLKQFPLNSRCNRVGSPQAQIGSCTAAYATEAAGMLGGPEAFWAMTEFLYKEYENSATLDSARLEAFLTEELSIPVEVFRAAMASDEVRGLVAGDVDEAIAIGMTQTPAVIINGQPFVAWHVPGNLASVVTRAASAETIPPVTAANDAPPSRGAALWGDWMRRAGQPQPVTGADMPALASQGEYVTGADRPIRVVSFMDYASPRSREVDGILRRLADEHDTVLYQPRLYPMQEDCNPFADVRESPNGCLIAGAALLVRESVSPETFFEFHDAMLAAEGTPTDAELDAAIANAGLDPAALRAEMSGERFSLRIMTETGVSGRIDSNRRAPVVYINGRILRVDELDGEWLIEDLLPVVVRDARTNPMRYAEPGMPPPGR